MLRRLRRHLLLLSLLAAALLAAAAYAAVPDSGTAVYHGCMSNGNGQLRLIDPSTDVNGNRGHCTSNETEVSWNEAGQTGPAGPPGPQGEQGDPGAGGPGDAYVVHQAVTVPVGGSGTSITELRLPAGAYAVSATLEFESFASEANDLFVSCELESPFGGNIGGSETAVGKDYFAIGSIAVQGATSLLVPGTVELRCHASVGLSLDVPRALNAYGGQLTAIEVGAVHSQ